MTKFDRQKTPEQRRAELLDSIDQHVGDILDDTTPINNTTIKVVERDLYPPSVRKWLDGESSYPVPDQITRARIQVAEVRDERWFALVISSAKSPSIVIRMDIHDQGPNIGITQVTSVSSMQQNDLGKQLATEETLNFIDQSLRNLLPDLIVHGVPN